MTVTYGREGVKSFTEDREVAWKKALAVVFTTRHHLLARVSLQMLWLCPAPPTQLALLSVPGMLWTLLHLRALANAISSSEKF